MYLHILHRHLINTFRQISPHCAEDVKALRTNFGLRLEGLA